MVPSDVVEELRDARARAGLTQGEVAASMSTSQSAVAPFEAGSSDPRLGTVRRFAAAVGADLVVITRGPGGLIAVADEVTRALSASDPAGAFRAVVQGLDDLVGWEPAEVDRALRTAPSPLGSREWDALLAAAAEYAAHRAGVPVPGWSAAPSRFLTSWWFPIEDVLGRLPVGLAAYALAHSPPEFAIRGVFIDPASLESI